MHYTLLIIIKIKGSAMLLNNKYILALITTSLLLTTPLSFANQQTVTIDMQAPSSQENASYTLIKNSGINSQFIAITDKYFNFNQALTVQYGGTEGPLYDPQTHFIHIPYDFITDSIQYFKNNNYQKNVNRSAQQAAIDTLMHTLIHEVGHAFIADHNIPVLGKEEDAVDNLATIIMLNYLDNGTNAAISAADMFAFESEDKPDYYDNSDYIDEHSFDLQRYFATLCLIYGHDPDAHSDLLDDIEKEYRVERKEFCIENYQHIKDSWGKYLAL